MLCLAVLVLLVECGAVENGLWLAVVNTHWYKHKLLIDNKFHAN